MLNVLFQRLMYVDIQACMRYSLLVRFASLSGVQELLARKFRN